jgi:pimeloyl-ACP methyl ester carboxylesterase
MIRLAERAEREGRLLQAAFYYRAAEFYILEEVPEKELLYDRFHDLFYRAVQGEEIEKAKVPYGDGFLPVMKVPASGIKKHTIVLHGGFDSFIEEFYSMIRYLSHHGYEIVAFEGPGQGAARRKYGLAFDIEWEKPVSAVMDFFNLTNVTLFGLSMGGWLCLRAAAFEPRVTRVIASGHAIDYMKSMNKLFYHIHRWFLKNHRDFTGLMAEWKFTRGKDNIAAWMVKHLMYITRKDKTIDALETYVSMNDRNIHSERVVQDVLLLLGEKDHFIPLKMLDMQAKALTNARSVAARVFTAEEHAQNHCQIGNIELSLEVILKWLDEVS